MKNFSRLLAGVRGRWLKGLIVISLALAAVPALAGAASASSSAAGDFQMTCGGGSTENMVTVYEQLNWSYTLTMGDDPNTSPVTEWGNLTGPGGPDNSYTQADATAAACGVSYFTSRADSGWSIGPNGAVGNNGQVLNSDGSLTFNEVAKKWITYTFSPGAPGNDEPVLPGAGATHVNTGSLDAGSGPEPQEVPGCSFNTTISVSNTENVTFSYSPSSCSFPNLNGGSEIIGADVTCTQLGSIAGSSPTSITSPGNPNKVLNWQIPSGADSCTFTVWSGVGSGTVITPLSGYSIPWTSGAGFGGGHQVKPKAGSKPSLPTPTGVHVTASGNVSWNPVSGAATYAIERDGDPSTIQYVDGGQTSFQDTVTGTAAHTYQVAAQPDLFPAQAASWSDPVTEPPVNVRYAQGVASWDPVAAHDQAGGYYNLYLNGSKFATVAGTSFTIPGSPSASGTSYTMNVTSADPAGDDTSDRSAPASFTYLSPPSGVTAAQQCTISGRGTPCTLHTATVLQWQSVPGAVSYNVYRDGTLVGAGVGKYDDWADTTVTGGGTAYTYQITAVAADGSESPLSSTASVTIY